eukprot:685188-Prorocentrum_lima.AAC.1
MSSCPGHPIPKGPGSGRQEDPAPSAENADTAKASLRFVQRNNSGRVKPFVGLRGRFAPNPG